MANKIVEEEIKPVELTEEEIAKKKEIDKKVMRKLFFNSLYDLSIVGVALSLLISGIGMVFSGYGMVVFLSIITNVAIFIWTVNKLFKFRMRVSGKKRYYICNLSAMSVYCAVGVGWAAIMKLLDMASSSILNYAYTFLFYNFKCVHLLSYDHYGKYAVGKTWSAVIYAVIYLAIIAVLPLFINKEKLLGMKKKKQEEKEKEKDNNNETGL